MNKVDLREEWYDDKKKVSVAIVDVTRSARKLAAGHLCGPVSAYYLAKALASVALLASETSETEEALSIQMKCTGPLGGFNVECTADGALRGYTEKKVLDEFDGSPDRDDRRILGAQQIQVTRSVPGRIISQGISGSFDG
jgi:redox-regulated HSP33 family molecular chaperone